MLIYSPGASICRFSGITWWGLLWWLIEYTLHGLHPNHFCFRELSIPGQKNFQARPLIPSALRWVAWSSLTSSCRLSLGIRISVPFLITNFLLTKVTTLRLSQKDLNWCSSDSFLMVSMSVCCLMKEMSLKYFWSPKTTLAKISILRFLHIKT